MSSMSTSAPSTTRTTTTMPSMVTSDSYSPAQSLLSLSIAASSVPPIPISALTSSAESAATLTMNGGPTSSSALSASSGSVGTTKHQRRLSSAGKAKRRLSDARDAASRPSPSSLSLATLSLSSSSPPPHLFAGHGSSDGTAGVPNSFTAASNALGGGVPSQPVSHTSGVSIGSTNPIGSAPNASTINIGSAPTASSLPSNTIINSTPIPMNGKKRGLEHRCEGCSKVYRHPSCLIKHRWEHTPHWRESSKHILSKHAQVQLLEAAAILSHFSAESATGTNLPGDRSLWPSFLSGGSASVPVTSILRSDSGASTSSVTPARAPSVGPRLHDFAIPTTDVTQVRPGLYVMGGSAPSSAPSGDAIHIDNSASSVSNPVAVPNESATGLRGIGYGNHASSFGGSSSYRHPSSNGSHSKSTSYHPAISISASSFASSSYNSTTLSIPRSSLRSGSVFSESERSSSLEEEDEDEDASVDDRGYHAYKYDDDADVDVDGDVDISGRDRDGYTFPGRGDSVKQNFDEYGFEYERGIDVTVGLGPVKIPQSVNGLDSTKEEDWEMEMDMD